MFYTVKEYCKDKQLTTKDQRTIGQISATISGYVLSTRRTTFEDGMSVRVYPGSIIEAATDLITTFKPNIKKVKLRRNKE